MSLRIVVTVKYVPDATGDRHFADDLTVDRDDVDGLLSELDEYAVEQALQISEGRRQGGDDDVEITVLGAQAEARAHFTEYLPPKSWFLLVEPSELQEEGRRYLNRVEHPQEYFSTSANVARKE